MILQNEKLHWGWSLALGMGLLSGCGAPPSPTIPNSQKTVVVLSKDGTYGYYDSKRTFCTYGNNYCGTGQSYGIHYTSGTTYYQGCDAYGTCSASYPGYVASSGGYSNGSYSGGSYSSTNNGSGSGTSNGSGDGYVNNYGTSNGSGDGYTNNYSNYNWGYSYYNSNNGSGSGSNNGSGNGYTNNYGTNYGNNWNYNYNYNYNNYNSGNSYTDNTGNNGWYSTGSETTDTDLQLAQAQGNDRENRAQSLSTEFQMNIESARQLTQIADKLRVLTESGSGLSLEDRDAIRHAALSVAGIGMAEVNDAVTKMVQQSDQKPILDLVNQAARNLGMPHSAGLREKLLPSLGIQF